MISFSPSPAYSLVCKIAREIEAEGGRALLVGGCVRDTMLALEPKDYDVEVFGVEQGYLESILTRVGNVLQVGRSFPVWKVWTDDMSQGEAVDVALPRYETKVGEGHTDFTVTLDPDMSFEDASSRRDVTMNAMGYDPLTGELEDPHGGADDLKAGIIRHVSHHFAEDPLRALRIMQFAARFDMGVHPETIALCSTLSPAHLSTERIWEEWTKLILKGRQISRGLDFLIDCGWIKHFPEFAALIGVPQDPIFHPEGTAFQHTLYCMNAFAATRLGDDREDLIVGLAVLCHDLGKATTTTIGEDGKIHAYGHEEAGETPTRAFLSRLTNEEDLINDVVALVVSHMQPTFLWQEATRGGTAKLMNTSLRRLARKVRLDRLARVVFCDKAGRPPKPQVSPEADWLKSRAEEIHVLNAAPKPLLMGRHLISLGMKPGIEFKAILESAMELQLNGDITTLDEAIAYANAFASQPVERQKIFPR